MKQVTAGANQVLFASDDDGRLADLARPVASEAVGILYDGRSLMQSTVDPTLAVTEPTYSSEGLLYALRQTPRSVRSGPCNGRRRARRALQAL